MAPVEFFSSRCVRPWAATAAGASGPWLHPLKLVALAAPSVIISAEKPRRARAFRLPLRPHMRSGGGMMSGHKRAGIRAAPGLAPQDSNTSRWSGVIKALEGRRGAHTGFQFEFTFTGQDVTDSFDTKWAQEGRIVLCRPITSQKTPAPVTATPGFPEYPARRRRRVEGPEDFPACNISG
jgi:hypothetical protein